MSRNGGSPAAVIVFSFPVGSEETLELLESVLNQTLPHSGKWRCTAICVVHDLPHGKIPLVERHQADGSLHLLDEGGEQGVPPLQRCVREAVEGLGAEVIVELDDAGARVPGLALKMLQGLEPDTDLALCSRNMKHAGLTIRENRRGSRLESLLSRIALFFPTRAWFRVTDPTAGNRAYRVSAVVREAASHPGTVAGYRIDSLYRMVRDRQTVREIPHPPVRERGSLGVRAQPLHTLRRSLGLRWRDPETRRFVKFGTVGFTGYLINASALELFRNIRLSYVIAHFFSQFPTLSRFSLLTSQSAWSASLAAELAILSNYMLNNFWTFSSHKIKSPLRFIGKMLQFNLTSFGAVVMQFFVIGLATMLFEDTALVRGVALVFAVVFLIIPYNWTIYNRLIWRVKRRKGK